MDTDFSDNPDEMSGNLKFFNKTVNLLISSRYLKNSKILS